MLCPKCHKQVEGSTLFCNHCGSYLKETLDHDASLGLSGMRPRRKRRTLGWLILLAALALVLALGFGIGWLIVALMDAPSDGAIVPPPEVTPEVTAPAQSLPTAAVSTAKPDVSVVPELTGSAAPDKTPEAQQSAAPDATATQAPDAAATVKPQATQTPKPTATAKPTTAPTAKPTAAPTVKPTEKPTPKPTAKPTAKPSATAAIRAPEGEYLLPDSNTRLLEKSELEHMTFMELVYARNEIYARHGYSFKDPKLKVYFEARSWYKASSSYSYSKLSSIERENIAIIKSVENTK